MRLSKKNHAYSKKTIKSDYITFQYFKVLQPKIQEFSTSFVPPHRLETMTKDETILDHFKVVSTYPPSNWSGIVTLNWCRYANIKLVKDSHNTLSLSFL